MTFEEILDQAMAMLQRRGRLTYGTLKRQFQLDDAALEDLQAELIYGQRLAVDEDERVLVWCGAPVPVQIRVGLHAGAVVVRAIDSSLHMDYTAVGQTTHLNDKADGWRELPVHTNDVRNVLCQERLQLCMAGNNGGREGLPSPSPRHPSPDLDRRGILGFGCLRGRPCHGYLQVP